MRSPRSLRRHTILRIEELEDRTSPAVDPLTLIVDTSNDVIDGGSIADPRGPDGLLSFREAITVSNLTLGPNLILFNIPGSSVIQLGSALPDITTTVVIDGYSQPGSAPNTNPLSLGSNAKIKVVLDGTNSKATDGLMVNVSQSTIRGLAIYGFKNGITLLGTDNRIVGNFIGLHPDPQSDALNTEFGVRIKANSNIIGGKDAADRNVISSNSDAGISIAFSGGNLIRGNLIGTSADGQSAKGNGVGIESGTSNADLIIENVISGNKGDGISINAAFLGNTIQGNLVGVTADGGSALGNQGNGIKLFASSEQLIGGDAVQIDGAFVNSENVIAGNAQNGIEIIGGGEHKIQGNVIGLAQVGISQLGNGANGILIQDSSKNTVGGDKTALRNVISGNSLAGIAIKRVAPEGTELADENRIQGNVIGLDRFGVQAKDGNGKSLGNKIGVLLQGGSNNEIGGVLGMLSPGSPPGNVIANNDQAGILIESAIGGKDGKTELVASSNKILGNNIGTSEDGKVGFGNRGEGIRLNQAVTTDIGAANARNIISANALQGVVLNGGSGATILNNLIGLRGSLQKLFL